MWKVYKWDGRFIQGELIGRHTSERAALKKAENEIGHAQTEKQEDKAGKETIIWLDGENGNPLGVIVKKNKTKRAKKSPKK